MRLIFQLAFALLFSACSNSDRAETKTEYPQPVINEPVIYTEGDLAGIWNVVMEVSETTCDSKKVGDITAERWVFEKENDKLIVRVKDNSLTNDRYEGTFNNNILKLHGKAYGLFQEGDVNVKVEIIGGNAFSGTREIIINTPCKILYNITATKN